MVTTRTSEGLVIRFVATEHYEQLAARKAAAREERRRLMKENQRRAAAGLPELTGQLCLPGFEDDAPEQRRLF